MSIINVPGFEPLISIVTALSKEIYYSDNDGQINQ